MQLYLDMEVLQTKKTNIENVKKKNIYIESTGGVSLA